MFITARRPPSKLSRFSSHFSRNVLRTERRAIVSATNGAPRLGQVAAIVGQ